MSIDLNSDPSNPVSDVIWIQTGFIGDILLTTAAMAALNHNLPDVRQHLITTEIGKMALQDHPLLTDIQTFSKRDGSLTSMMRLRHHFRSAGFRRPVILQPHKSARSTLLAHCVGFPIITYHETTGSVFATRTVPRVAVLHETDRIALLLEGLGIQREHALGRRPMMASGSKTEALPKSAEALATPRKWIAMAPGSVWATKRWPTSKFATLAQLLLDRPDTGIILLGSKDEMSAAQFIEESCLRGRPETRERLINLAGKTSLTDLKGIYPRLSLLISNDSSPVHYASAFNIPTIAIFGATVPAQGFAPLAENSRVAQVRLDCRPCSDHGPKTCPLGHFKCMNDLSVESVFAMTEGL